MAATPITIYLGESTTIRVGPLTDQDGAAIDPDDADSIEFQVKARAGMPDGDADANILISKTAEVDGGITVDTGIIVIELEPEDTETIGVGRFYYDVWIEIGGRRLLAAHPAAFTVRAVVNLP
jgi:hypothetical protein